MRVGCEWIPVDQRLPAEAVRVLATDGTDVFDSEYCFGNWEWCADVTHWTELPEPPRVSDEVQCLRDKAAENGRRRLTDAERFVLKEVTKSLADTDDVVAAEQAAVIDWLLERTR
jgi:hypothetical protein